MPRREATARALRSSGPAVAGDVRAGRWVWLGTVALAVAAAVLVLHRLGEHASGVPPAHDVYMHFYPIMLEARAAVAAHGRGLFWNPYQSCGQPFAAMVMTGLFYPPHAAFAVLDPVLALRTVLAFNLVVAGVNAFWLGLELGAGVPASLAGALVFEAGSMLHATTWEPNVAGTLAWMPAVLACTERLVRRPVLRRAAVLAVALAVCALPGYPQNVLFAVELVVLRVGWEMATSLAPSRLRLGMLLGVALVLAGLLDAAQLLPALDVVRESVRNAPLTAAEIAPGRNDWDAIRHSLAFRDGTRMPVGLVALAVAGLGILTPAIRRRAAFYLTAAVLAALLSFGPSTPLFPLYARLPVVSHFRDPNKFVFVASFCVATATALGIAALESGPGRRATWFGLAMVTLTVGSFVVLIGRLTWLEWTLAVAIALVLGAVAVGRSSPRWGALAIAALVVAHTLAEPLTTWMKLLDTDAPLRVHADLFARLRRRLTSQDRVYLVYEDPLAARFALMPKTATIFGVSSIQDYEPLGSRRYAEVLGVLETGTDADIVPGRYSKRLQGLDWRLLDLTAARYVVVDTAVRAKVVPPDLFLVDTDATARVYENRSALPRARFVPTIEVVPDAAQLWQRMAHGGIDLRPTAFVEQASTSFRGTPGARGRVRFVSDDPEQVVLHVKTTAAGFLFLADQYFPGWQATVDGTPAPILRADHAFRIVPVPRGASTVVFRYLPTTFVLGAAVSALAAVVTAVILAVHPGGGRES